MIFWKLRERPFRWCVRRLIWACFWQNENRKLWPVPNLGFEHTIWKSSSKLSKNHWIWTSNNYRANSSICSAFKMKGIKYRASLNGHNFSYVGPITWFSERLERFKSCKRPVFDKIPLCDVLTCFIDYLVSPTASPQNPGEPAPLALDQHWFYSHTHNTIGGYEWDGWPYYCQQTTEGGEEKRREEVRARVSNITLWHTIYSGTPL